MLAPTGSAATGILAVGDFGVGGVQQRALGAAMRAYEAQNPSQLLVTMGDNDYTEGRAFARSWRESFGWLRGAGVDVAGALGNHDIRHRRGRYQFGLLGMPGPNYVRRVNEVEVIVLDSNAVTPAQTRWLRRTLARRTGLRRIAVFHHPPYTCGTYLGHPAVQRSWVPLFERYGVHLVLNGHDHNYQRFVTRGVTYVVHGGGAGLRPVKRCPRSYPPRPGFGTVRGFVHLTVERTGFLVRIVDYLGRTVDRFRVT